MLNIKMDRNTPWISGSTMVTDRLGKVSGTGQVLNQHVNYNKLKYQLSSVTEETDLP
jgi:hypothetical protein